MKAAVLVNGKSKTLRRFIKKMFQMCLVSAGTDAKTVAVGLVDSVHK
jgi:hypothetical protein